MKFNDYELKQIKLIAQADRVLKTSRYRSRMVWDIPELYLGEVLELQAEIGRVHDWGVWYVLENEDAPIYMLDHSAARLSIIVESIRHYISTSDGEAYQSEIAMHRRILKDTVFDLGHALPPGQTPIPLWKLKRGGSRDPTAHQILNSRNWMFSGDARNKSKGR